MALPMNARERTSSTVEVLALLPLPAIADLSEQQVRGITCVWDGIALTPATAVDLGVRTMNRLGEKRQWYPRACRRCIGDGAYRLLLDHSPACDRCRKDGGCELGRALNRLVREGRR